MQHLYKCLLGAIVLATVIGCTSTPVSGPEKVVTVSPEAGRFGMSHMKNLSKQQAGTSVKEGENVSFDLGQIRGSTGFYFLLYNIGSRPITDVTLSIQSLNFAVYPNSIDSLQPGNDVGMLPIVKVSAFHGTPYDGVGNRPMLLMGENTFTLLISGTTTTAEGADTTVTFHAAMSLEALVMDFEAEGMYQPYNFDNAPLSIRDKFSTLNKKMEKSAIPFTNTRCTGDSAITISNTGNVSLRCLVYRTRECQKGTSCNVVLDAWEDIAPDGIFTYTIKDDNEDEYLFILNGDNAVSKLELLDQDIGAYFFAVALGKSDCAGAEINERRLAYLAEREGIDCSSVWALIDNNVLFYGQSFNAGDSVYMEMYDLSEEKIMVTYIGDKNSGAVQCLTEQEQYCSDMKLIIDQLSSDTDLRILNGALGRVSTGGSRRWEESGL